MSPAPSPEPGLIKHRDLTGALVYFTEQSIAGLAQSMEPQQRRNLRLVAETISAPAEIWQQWVRDSKSPGSWEKRRTYLRIVRTAEQELTGDALGIAVEFVYTSRWDIGGVHLMVSSLVNVEGNMNETFRQGERMYPLADEDALR